ncbi:hypothetical protein [Streptomyces sp. MMBL 11-3]|uniref:hypothetical protein n=1 Tax=Streptomyces sp. MMBL 11-3 TaxID=3382639 RepID=UPI0039B4245F
MRRLLPPPPADQLRLEAYSGWACCFCGTKLTTGAVSAGISRGSVGAHVLDVEVWACPGCAKRPLTARQTPRLTSP